MLLGWIGAIFIGLSLGLLGSGGSILTVPVLIYLFGQEEKLAIAGSLAIVGTIALAGAAAYIKLGLIAWKTVVIFAIPSMVATYIGAFLATYLSGITQLIIFACIMFLAAIFMLRNAKYEQTQQNFSALKIFSSGSVVGIMTGLIGVGGGFLILPSLVLFAGLGMRQAVASSLVIIASNAYMGFVKYFMILQQGDIRLDWTIIISVSLIGIIGTIIGNYLCHKIPQQRLKKYFAYFLLLMAIFIISKEVSRSLS